MIDEHTRFTEHQSLAEEARAEMLLALLKSGENLLDGLLEGPDHFVRLGIAQQSAGRPAAAELSFSRALDQHKESAHTLLGLGYARQTQGRVRKAIEAYRQAVELDPSCFLAQFNLGIAMQEVDDPVNSIEALERAVTLDPCHAQARFALGIAYQLAAAPDKAVAAFEQAAKLAPENNHILLSLANILFREDHLDRATEVYSELLSRSPDLIEAQFNLAELHARRGNANAAGAQLRDVLQRHPDQQVTVCLKLLDIGVLDDEFLIDTRNWLLKNEETENNSAETASIFWFHAYRQGRLAESVRLFKDFRDRNVPPYPANDRKWADFLLRAWSTVRADYEFCDPSPEKADSREAAGKLTWIAKSGASHDYIVFLSCDGVYWRQFGPDVVESIARSSPEARIHVHLCDPDTQDIAGIKPYLNDGCVVGLTSTRLIPAHNRTHALAKATYACTRFVWLEQAAENYDCPIIQIDVDAYARKDFRNLIDACAEVDVGMLRLSGQRGPFREFQAGFTCINPTTAARSYLASVSTYIQSLMRDGCIEWMADQSALYCCYQLAKDRGLAPTVRFFDFDSFDACEFISRKSWQDSND